MLTSGSYCSTYSWHAGGTHPAGMLSRLTMCTRHCHQYSFQMDNIQKRIIFHSLLVIVSKLYIMILYPIEVFVNNTNLTYLAFLYKISIEVS